MYPFRKEHPNGTNGMGPSFYDLLPHCTQVYPVESPALTTVACGQNFSVSVEGRSATVLSLSLLSPTTLTTLQHQKQPMVVGRAVRTGSEAVLDASGAVVIVGGLFDAGWSLDDCPAPGYLLVPSDSRSGLKSVIATASGKALSMVWSVGKVDQPEGRSLDACGTARAVSPPHPPAGFDVLALWPAAATEDPSTPSPTFVHSQPVEGMAYNASFAGGLLTGTVQVRHSHVRTLAPRLLLSACLHSVYILRIVL